MSKRIIYQFDAPVPYRKDFWYEVLDETWGPRLLPSDTPLEVKQYIREMINRDTPRLRPPEQNLVQGDVLALEFWTRDRKILFAAIYGITKEALPEGQYAIFNQTLSDAGIIESADIAFPFVICHGNYPSLFNKLGRKGKLLGTQFAYYAFPFSFPNDFVFYPWASEAGVSDFYHPQYLEYSKECKRLIKEYMENIMGVVFDINFSLVEHLSRLT